MTKCECKTVKLKFAGRRLADPFHEAQGGKKAWPTILTSSVLIYNLQDRFEEHSAIQIFCTLTFVIK